MKTLLSTTAVVLALSTPAFADCMQDLEALQGKMGQVGQGEQARQAEQAYQVSGELRRDIRELRDAARTLHENGQDEACSSVVASIEEMIKKEQEQAAKSDASTQTGEKTPGETMTGTQQTESSQQGETARLATAKPVSEASQGMRANNIIGADVRNPQNDELGEITDVVIHPQEGPQYAVVTSGGFLGVGGREVVVPWEQLKITEEQDVFVLNMSEEQLENAPEVELDDRVQLEDQKWRDDVDKYYREQGEASPATTDR
jgi:sporulation protein YlmC with PRC-barrel domain